MSLVRAKATIKPILQVLSDGKIHRDEDVQEAVAKKLRLTAEDRRMLMKNGTPFYKNRTAWGLVYIQNTAYLPDTKPWGKKVSGGSSIETYEITKAGLTALRNGLADGVVGPRPGNRKAT
jgi:restriction endonuclease Mrr